MIAEGVRIMKENESSLFYECYITWCPLLRFGRKLKKAMRREEPGAKSVGVVHFSDQKRYRSRQGTVTAERLSRGMMYRKELV